MMTNAWVETPPPSAAYFHSSDWPSDQRARGYWSQQENKLFEDALAHFDKDTPDRWEKVARMIPGKTEGDVVSHYRDLVEDVSHIEAGLIPFPCYSSSITLDWEDSHGYEAGLKQSYCPGGKRPGARPSDHERKKGVPWTEDEHRLFLLGLEKHGKGDWRNISRNFVVSRTPTQVASHAQKYFIRLNSGSKDKRRSSIHDITTVNLSDHNGPPSPSQSTSSVARPGASDRFSAIADSSQHGEEASVFTPSAHGSQFMQPPYGMNPHRMRSGAQHLHRPSLHDSMVGHHGMLFQMQPDHPRPHG